MASEITIPRLGWSMEEGSFAAWIKKEGDKVAIGDPLFVLEGEKSLQEIEALDSGVLRLLPLSPKTGDVVKVGQVIGLLAGVNEPLPAAGAGAAAPPASEATPPTIVPLQPAAKAPVPAPVAPESQPATAPAMAPSTPRARRAAAELRVQLDAITGTGKEGRIRERDVQNASRGEISAPAPGRTEVAPTPASIPITSLRRTIAERMVTSLANTAPVTLNSCADMTNLVALRLELKAATKGALVPSFNDLLVKLSACALNRFPMVAGKWLDNHIELPASINIGIAVDTEHGLLVPVIRDVPALSLPKLAGASRALIAAAQSRRIKPDDLQGGVFTVTNLGSLGIDAFTPIINFPEIAILGVGAIRKTPTVLSDGTIAVRELVTLSLTFDHRVIDGAPAARFLQALVKSIESPLPWLLGFVPSDEGT